MEAVLVWSLVLSWATLVSSARITITPPTITNGETSDITVKCEPGSALSNIQSLTYIRIERDVSNPPATPLRVASAIAGSDNGQAKFDDDLLGTRGTVSGYAKNEDIPGSFVEVHLSQLTCNDAGSYFCEVNFINLSGDSQTTNDDAGVEYRDDPSDIVLTQNPLGPNDPGSTLNLHCTANVGTPYTQPVPWTWQWTEGGSWTGYMGGGPIVNDPVTNDNCVNTGASTLSHTITASDNGRKFRCVVNGDETFSDKVTICTIHDPSDTQLTQTPSGPISPGSTVTFLCTSNVGNPYDTPTPWMWEWTENDTWTRYPDNTAIVDDPVNTDICDNTGSTTLTHTVTTSDNDRKFRCVVNGNAEFSGEATVCLTSDPSYVQLTQDPPGFVNPGSNVTLHCTANVGNPYEPNPWSWDWTENYIWFPYPNDTAIDDDQVTTENCTNTGSTTLVHNVTDSDNGRKFRCLVNNSEEHSAEVMLCFVSSPGNVQTTQTPDAILDPDDVVELKCSGDVGTPYITPTWSWQWKDSDVWKRYPNSDRITDDPIVATDCDNVGATTLKHVVTEEDNGRMFRCLVNGDEQYVGSFEIHVQLPDPKSAGIHSRGDYSTSLGFALFVLFLVYRV